MAVCLFFRLKANMLFATAVVQNLHAAPDTWTGFFDNEIALSGSRFFNTPFYWLYCCAFLGCPRFVCSGHIKDLKFSAP
jgi:hypothetical protein